MSDKQILFVCMGNICRSPSAEAVMKSMVEESGMDIYVDSAGTIAHHAGEPADRRMQQHARQRSYDLTSISRQIVAEDFDSFDLIVAMDDDNMAYLKSHAGVHQDKLVKMTDYCTHFNYSSVPDPYYGGAAGFELVLDLLEDACAGLLAYCKRDI